MRLDFGTCLWMFQVSFGASKRGSSDFKLSTLKIVVEKSSPTPFPSKQFWKFLRKKRMKNKFRAKRVRFEIRLKKRFVFKFSSRVRTLLLLLAEFFFRELSFSSDFASSSKIRFDLSWSKTSSFFVWKRTLKKWRSLFFSSLVRCSVLSKIVASWCCDSNSSILFFDRVIFSEAIRSCRVISSTKKQSKLSRFKSFSASFPF